MEPTIRAMTFYEAYQKILQRLHTDGVVVTTRKGETITELVDASFVIQDPMQCLSARDFSKKYLEGEFGWYLSGSLLLEDAERLSKFWRKCSDNGETVNSNYGYLLFHELGGGGVSQFEHALRCLRNSRHSKKAVMTLYNPGHAYLSNDNPCTMFLQLRINQFNELCITTHMRSSDVYYGLPYDVPFFCFVQYAAYRVLSLHYPELVLGQYTHIAGSLHRYAKNVNELNDAMTKGAQSPTDLMETTAYTTELFERSYVDLAGSAPFAEEIFMRRAWDASLDSGCLKKKVGASVHYPNEGLTYTAHGGKDGDPCVECVRDVNKAARRAGRAEPDPWYGDECPSVHSEMRLVCKLLRDNDGAIDPDAVVYVTHGPCDACLKLLNHVGIRSVIWDVPYKTDYGHWPEIKVRKVLKFFEQSCATRPDRKSCAVYGQDAPEEGFVELDLKEQA